jgi:hypothetical protein
MDLNQLKSDVEKKLKSGLISPRVLLDHLRLMDEESRRSPPYQDPNYLPFYYHLSRHLNVRSVLHVGFNLALPLCCFLRGSSSAKSAVCLQIDSGSFYSPRLALANIKGTKGRSFPVDFHLGSVADEVFSRMISGGMDIAMVTERLGSGLPDVLEVCWQNLNLDGFLVLDRSPPDSSEGRLFSDFCKSKNRDSVFFRTRYGTAFAAK